MLNLKSPEKRDKITQILNEIARESVTGRVQKRREKKLRALVHCAVSQEEAIN